MTNAAELYRILRRAGPAPVTLEGIAEPKPVIAANDLFAAMIPIMPTASEYRYPPKYRSEWNRKTANERQNDCGPACVDGILAGRGIDVTVNQLPTANATGLTDVFDLQALLKDYGIASNIEYSSPSATLEQVVKPYSILLVNYAPLRLYAQDVRYMGWHWLISIGPVSGDPTMWETLDPDFWDAREMEGDHKRYPTEALRAAFRAYPGQSQAVCLYVPDDPIPLHPPFQSYDVVIDTGALNVRTGPGTTFTAISKYVQGQFAQVLEKRSGWLRTAKGWISEFYTKVKPAAPAPSPTPTTPPVVDVPPVIEPIPQPKQQSGIGPHLLQGGSIPSAKYPIYKTVDQDDMLAEAYRKNPDAMFIRRRFYTDDEQTQRLAEMRASGIEVAYNRWYAENKSAIDRFPFAYFESYNEVFAPDEFLAFEKYRTEQLAALSSPRKACVLNMQCGHTDKVMWARPLAVAMVDAVIKADGVIGEHFYAQAVMSSNCNDSYWMPDSGQWSGGELFPKMLRPLDCHTGARIVQSKYHLAQQGQGQAVVVGTEVGISDVSNQANKIPYALGIKTSGWRTCFDVWSRMGWLKGITPEQFYMQQLLWWAEATNSLGVIFTHGTAGDSKSQWASFDTMGLL